MFGLSLPLQLAGVTTLAVLALAAGRFWPSRQPADDTPTATVAERATDAVVFVDENGEETERVEGVVVDDDGAVELPPPNVQTSTFGIVEEFARFYRRRSKRRRLARRGYIRWILADETYSEPKFIKPEEKGGGIPEYEHDGSTYLFPRSAALADEQTGMWTFVHKKNEADPVNLRDPVRMAIPGDSLKEYLDTRVSKDPPGWWGSLNLDTMDLMKYGMAAIVLFALLRRFL